MKAHIKSFTREVYSIVAEWNNPDIDVPESDLEMWRKAIDDYRYVQMKIKSALQEAGVLEPPVVKIIGKGRSYD